ncbi:NPC intracellular cholesterol transporter 2-like [Diorhabda carinulata]|uniref:NPC intracellular cholesterol transporter 2-like n=1 Tax=Diorhabda carinulata TaxID=1163345 RepID=UPI0025A27B72|nr:NPC intracellular cholesterol transporter 2-like [Diorhabda carinulata]
MAARKVIFSVLCLVIYFTCLVSSANIRDCGSKDGSIIKVDIEGCDNEARCPLVRGQNATLTATFKSNVTSNTLKAVVYGKLSFIKSKFPLPDPNACDLGVNCPLGPGQTNTYIVSIYVKENYPTLSVDIELHLRDDSGRDVICALIPAAVVAAVVDEDNGQQLK